MERKELLKNAGYWECNIQLDLAREFKTYMELNNLSRLQLAKKLKISTWKVSQILIGDFKGSVYQFIELCLAIDKTFEIKYSNIIN